MQRSKIWYLEKIDLFSGLSADEMAWLDKATRMITLKRNQPVYLPEDPSDSVFFIKAGQVRICRVLEDGRQLTLALLGPGEMFGELEVIEESPRDTSAEAVEDTFVCALPRPEFESLLTRRPDLARRLTKLIGFRLKRIESRIEDLIFRDVPVRLARLLLQLSNDLGVADSRGVLIRVKLTHQELANLIGSTRETVTTMLGDFKRSGLIAFAERRIIVCDPAALSRRAGRVIRQVPSA